MGDTTTGTGIGESAYRIVGTAGHIDHGKSALVRALTGIDPDRLQEEKERGITIDLGFAHLDLDDDLRVGFVDVPGHERFVKNMLAGIGGIDAVLLVVAADESVMPQTREHFAICRLLGIRTGLVAITKCDLVEEEIVDLVELEVTDLLRGSFLEEAPVVRTSVVADRGLGELRRAIDTTVRSSEERAGGPVPRLPIDRVFTVKGFGTVVTGTLISGAIRSGDDLTVYPSGLPVSVRGIQVHGEEVEVVGSGHRTALNLHGVDVDDVRRGDLLAPAGLHRPTYLLDAELQVLPEFGPLEYLDRVRFHHGAAEVMARVATLESEAVPPGDSQRVQLRLEERYVAAPDDRFIVRRYSPMVTLGGGAIIDPLPDKHKPQRPATLDLLERLRRGDAAERIVAWAEERGLRGLDLEELVPRLVRPADDVRGAAERAAERGDIVIVDRDRLHVVPREPFEKLVEETAAAVARFHAERPLLPFMPKEEARTSVAEDLPAAVFDRVVEELRERQELQLRGEGLARTDHVVELTDEQLRVGEEIEARFREAGLQPPDPEEVVTAVGADDEEARRLLHHLLRRDRLLRLGGGHVFHAEAFEGLVDRIRQRYSPGERFSVGEFKELAGVTRKHAIPLLEHLDRVRVTRRLGDERELR